MRAIMYDFLGRIQVEASAVSTTATPDGTGSCTYDPDSETGLILAHRNSLGSIQNGFFFSFLMQTGLRP